ncbi:AbrB/MazE/SpoVT family DNA-binding domain-containing protein [Candidatus Peregrinibacteria bacterium]|nr:AbrB/MazE/SpoVT family DNA-binding domain-containing protein [Candidatus Peregrinibacteria bacterium]
MNYSTAQVNVKYQVVIPKEVRKIVEVKPNEKMGVFPLDKNTIVLRKIPTSILDLEGSYKFPKDYLKKERLSW